MAGAATPQPVDSDEIALTRPVRPDDLRVLVDPLAATGPSRWRLAGGRVEAPSGRPVAGAAVSWRFTGTRAARTPPRLGGRSSGATQDLLAAGATTTSPDGRFVAILDVPDLGASGGSSSLVVVARRAGGPAVAARTYLRELAPGLRLDLSGSVVVTEGEAAHILVRRKRALDGAARPGQTEVLLLRQAELPEAQLVDYAKADKGTERDVFRNQTVIESSEELLDAMPPGRIVEGPARSDTTQPGPGRWSPSAGYRPGSTAWKPETRDSNGKVATARQTLIVGSSVRPPLPLALVAGLGTSWAPAGFVSSAPGTGTVVLEVFRPQGRPLETRMLRSPAAAVVGIAGDREALVGVRAIAVRDGAVLQLDGVFKEMGGGLRLTVASMSPTLECMVAADDGTPVAGAEVAALAVGRDGHTWGLHRGGWGSRSPGPLLTSDNGLVPNVLSLGPPTGLPVVRTWPRERPLLGPFDRWEPFQGGMGEGGPLPPLPWVRPEGGYSTVPQETGRPALPAPWPKLWAPHLVTDARGRARTAFAPPPPGTVWRVGLVAVTKDGRWGYLETLVYAVTVADATRAATPGGDAR